MRYFDKAGTQAFLMQSKVKRQTRQPKSVRFIIQNSFMERIDIKNLDI